jgi:hypothetical protein
LDPTTPAPTPADPPTPPPGRAFAFRAAVNSEHAATSSARANLHAVETKEIATEAAAAATQAASTGEVVKDALRDIQDNPNMPGTPGFLARND